MRRVWVILLLLVCAATAVSSARGLGRIVEADLDSSELLYLPNGKFLKIASLGQAPVLADLIYIWAIQYYSNYTRADRYRYVEHVFGNVIAELDTLACDVFASSSASCEAGLRRVTGRPYRSFWSLLDRAASAIICP